MKQPATVSPAHPVLAEEQIAELRRLEAKASKGPWATLPWRQDEDGERHPPEITDAAGTVVFSVCYDHPMRVEEANTALIAYLRNAAPQLLAMAATVWELKGLLRECGRQLEWLSIDQKFAINGSERATYEKLVLPLFGRIDAALERKGE